METPAGTGVASPVDAGSGVQSGGQDRATQGNQRSTPLISGLLTDQGLIGPGRIVDATIAFTGTANRGDVVELYLNGQMAGSSLVRDDGSWMLDYSVISLAPGTYVCTLNAVAADGDALASAAPFIFTYDPSAPVAPVISGITQDTATPLDGITSDNTLLISGTAEAGSTLELFLNTVLIASVPVDGAGNWMVDYTAVTLPDGVYNLSAESIYLTLRSATSPLFPVVMDTQNPLVPIIQSIDPDTGISTTDGITTNPNLILAGTAEPFAVVRVRLGSVLVGSTTAAMDGSWSFNYSAVALAEGTHLFTAMQMDRAGNASGWSAPFIVVVDVTPPAPVMTQNVGPDTGVAGDGITGANQLSVSGTANGGDWVRIYRDGTEIGLVEVDGDGNWLFDYSTVTLSDGTYDFSVVVSDVAGNLSPPSTVMSIIVDTVAPPAPLISAFDDDTGIAGDQLTADATPTLYGSAEPGSLVTVSMDGNPLGTVSANEMGAWQFTVPGAGLVSATYSFTATATDAAGNQSAVSAVFNLAVDTIAPIAPVVTGISPDNGTPGDGVTNVATLIFSGTAEAGASVIIYINGVQTAVRTSDGAGNWMLDHTATVLADGSHQITARAQDAAGNLSPLSTVFTLVVDTAVLATPVVSGIDQDSGVVGDGITNVANLTFSGTATAGTSVTVQVNGLPVGMTTASGAGSWSYDHSAVTLPDGVHLITVVASNLAGTSATSAVYSLTVDTVAPPSPLVTSITGDSGVAGDFITNDATLVINGTAEAGARVDVFVDGVAVGFTSAGGAGTWSFDHTATILAEGHHAVAAQATDSAANTSAVSSAVDINIDTVAPLLSLVSPAPDAVNVAAGANLVMTFDSTVYAQTGNVTLRRVADNTIFEQIPVNDARVSGSGTTTITVNPAGTLVDGAGYYVQVDGSAFTDSAGNAFSGISDTTSWRFTTQDLVLTGSTPADNATNVALNSALILNFSLAALSNGGNIIIRHASDDSVFESIAVGSGQVSGTGTTTVTVTPSEVFQPNTVYYVEIDPGAFVSGNGGSFAGISGSGTLNFTTANPPVPVVTNVTSSTANGTYGQNAVITIQVQFSAVVNVSLSTPQLTLALQGVDRVASYVSGTGSNTLVFSYTVRFGDVSPDLDYVSVTALNANGARIRSAQYVNANLTLPVPGAAGSLSANKNLVITASTIDVGSMTSADGFQVQGSTALEHLGWAVRGVGDVNGDGFEDFVAAAPYNSSSAGVAYIVYGQPGATRSNINTSAISNGTNGFRIIGQSMLDYLGASVGGAGDINDDGYDDIYVVAPRNDDVNTDAGIVYVIFGKPTNTNVSISSFNSSHGFRITTSELGAAIGDSFTGYTSNGQALDAGGDFNGDGIQDLVLGIRFSNRNGGNSGKAYVIFGRAGATRSDVNLDLIDPTGPDGVLIQGAGIGWQLGQAARFVGDYDADGYDDVVVSAIYSNAVTSDGGQSFLIFGSPGPIFNMVDVTSLNGSSGFKISSTTSWGVLGHSVAGGDFNGDGISDLFISQNGYNTTVGAAHVIYGDAGGVYSNIDVDTMLSSKGYSIFGANIGEYLGHSLSSAGDFNADGYDDLLIASYLRDDNGADSGAAWLITGQPGTARGNLTIGSLNLQDGFKMIGGGIGDHFGQSTAFGDVNGDGFSDLIIGATWGDNASLDGGETVVLWGREFQSVIVAGTTGTAGADNLVGTSGNDTLVGGGGADAIFAGAGNDRIVVADTDFIRIDGGMGTDTLAFSAGLNTLDLSTIGPEVVRGIGVIDLGNLGNTLRVSKAGVQALSRESRAVFVRGGNADRVESVLGDAWCYTGTRMVAGVTYHVYLDNGAILYIESGIDHADVGSFNATQTYTFNTTITGANVSSAVTHFPVLIRVSNTIRNTLHPSRADIRFTDRDQLTWLPYEIEVGASGELFVWVLVPQVDGNSNSDYIVMHYNDRVDGAVPDRQNPAKVWADYAGVWHFSETSGNALDSTAYQNHGVQTGTVSRESSFVGRGVRFDTSTERFTVPYDLSFNASNKDFTVELWLDGTTNCTAHPISIRDYMTGVSRGEGSSRYWRIQTGGALPWTLGSIVSAPRVEISDTSGTDSLAALSWLSTDCSNHMVLVHNRSTGTQVYLNGALYATDGDVRNMENLQSIVIGNSGSTLSDMRIDEVRVMMSASSAARARLNYINQSGTSLVSPNF